MQNTAIYVNVIKRLLEQSSSIPMAACIMPGALSQATLYNPSLLTQLVIDDYKTNGNKSYIDSEFETLLPAILGFVSIRKTQDAKRGPCWGAWEVMQIAGKGYGKVLYGLAYDMTDNGLLTPDRMNVSDDAMRAWTKTASKNKNTKTFDDIKNPRTPEIEDDCLIHNNPVLDAAYEARPNILPGLENIHDETANEIYKLCKINVNKLAQAITNAGDTFFGQQYK